MKIAVVGLGYVGAVTAGCLVRLGHEVMGVDSDSAEGRRSRHRSVASLRAWA